MSTDAGWLAAADFVPHRPPMLLVDRVRPLGDSAEAAATVKSGWPVLNADNTLPGPALFEVMAQGYAAMAGLRAFASGISLEGRLGFLAGMRKFTVHGTARAGDELTVTAQVAAELGDFMVVEAQVRKRETLLASAQIKIFMATAEQLAAAATEEA